MNNPENLALTQYNFLTNLVTTALNDQMSEPLTTTNENNIFKDFIMPGIQWAIKKHHPNLSPQKLNNKTKTFVENLRTSSETPEHMAIFLSVIDYTSVLIAWLNNIPHKGTYTQLTVLPQGAIVSINLQNHAEKLRNFITSDPIGGLSLLTKFGTEQDIENFNTFIKKYKNTGKWDWEFFYKKGLMITITKSFEKLNMRDELFTRQKRIKEAKNKIYREKKPTNSIDKFVWKIKNAKYNTAKTFKESEVISKLKRKIKKLFGGD